MQLLHPLVLASSFLKSLLFASLTRDGLAAYLTVTAVDAGIRGAHLATSVGLTRSGLQLPVGSFVSPPRALSRADIALYATPVAAATWRSSAGAVEVAVNSMANAVPKVVVVNSAVVYRTVHTLVRQYDYYAGLLRMQPVLSLMSEEVHFQSHIHYDRTHHHPYSYPLPSSRPRTPLYALPVHWPSSLVSLVQSIAHPRHLESSSTDCRSPLTAVVSLGQCTPHRVLPIRGRVVLASDILGNPVPVADYYTQVLDELEEPKEGPKELVVYECSNDSCALSLIVEPPVETVNTMEPVYCMFWCCHSLLICLIVFRICCLSYQLVRWMWRPAKGICGYIRTGASTGAQDSALEPTPPSIPHDHSTAATAPSTPSAASFVAAQSTCSESAKKKKNKKKKKKKKAAGKGEVGVIDPADIPLPEDEDDDNEWTTIGPLEPSAIPTLSPPPSNAPSPATLAVCPTMVPLPESNDNDLAMEPTGELPTPCPEPSIALANDTTPPSPVLKLSTSSLLPVDEPAANDEEGGDWEMVAKRKPWLPFIRAPEGQPKAKKTRRRVRGGRKNGGKDVGEKMT